MKINGAKRQENFQLYFFMGKHPFDDEGKLFFLPRTPYFYLCPKIPGGAGPPPWDAQGGKEDYCPPVYATAHNNCDLMNKTICFVITSSTLMYCINVVFLFHNFLVLKRKVCVFREIFRNIFWKTTFSLCV